MLQCCSSLLNVLCVTVLAAFRSSCKSFPVTIGFSLTFVIITLSVCCEIL